MQLAETFETIRPSIVALCSRCAEHAKSPPPFPRIIGTGFIVDSRGVVMTNGHVTKALRKLKPGCASAILFGKPSSDGEQTGMPFIFRPVLAYNEIEWFAANGPFYGKKLPDIAFVQVGVSEAPPLSFKVGPNVIETGREIATAGFAMGTTPLVHETQVRQLMPFLRRGIVSSVHPFPCAQPHGFTMDIMTQGGESGSPVFLPESPDVVGIVYAGYDVTNITLAIPSELLMAAYVQGVQNQKLDLSKSPPFAELLAGEESEQLVWEEIKEEITTTKKKKK